MSKILIKGATIKGKEADLLIDGNIISKIAPKIDVRADRVISGKDRTVIPGLINMHTHAAMTLLRGASEDLPLQQWLNKIWSIEADLDPEMIYWEPSLRPSK